VADQCLLRLYPPLGPRRCLRSLPKPTWPGPHRPLAEGRNLRTCYHERSWFCAVAPVLGDPAYWLLDAVGRRCSWWTRSQEPGASLWTWASTPDDRHHRRWTTRVLWRRQAAESLRPDRTRPGLDVVWRRRRPSAASLKATVGLVHHLSTAFEPLQEENIIKLLKVACGV